MPTSPRIRPSQWEALRQAANDLGLADLGSVPAGDLGALRAQAWPDQPGGTGLPEWVEAGRHTSMTWLADTAALREDPRRWWPAARTALVALLAHDATGEPGDGPTGEGGAQPAGGASPRARLARYAWGRDYHLVGRRLLLALGRVLEREVPGSSFRLAVDAQPVAEKPLAALAGLGWIGKHGNLLRPRGSSWFFVAVLLTDAEREDLTPFPGDRCGTCRACLDACPTGAIVAPQVIDAGRCISYLTIEHVGATDPSLREATGAWVFGCDACQDACPWNAHRTRGGHERLAPGPLGRGPLVRDLLTLDEAGFTLATPKSALKRAGRSGLVRSAATAAGNSGDLSLVPDLAALLRDPVPAVRAHAAWALGRLGGAAAWRALEGARADEDEGVRAEVAGALARAG